MQEWIWKSIMAGFTMEDGRIIGVFVGSVAPGGESLDELNFFHPIRAFWERFVKGE